MRRTDAYKMGARLVTAAAVMAAALMQHAGPSGMPGAVRVAGSGTGGAASPRSGLSLSQAPASLRSAVLRAVGMRGASERWSQQAKLTASDRAEGDGLGNSAAIFGNTAVVGAPGKSSERGAVYVFTRSGTAWSRQARLAPSDRAPYDGFGNSVGITGSSAVAGSPFKDAQTGAAYVFVRSRPPSPPAPSPPVVKVTG